MCTVPRPFLHDDGQPCRVPVRRVSDLDRVAQLRPARRRQLRAAAGSATKEQRAHRAHRGREALEETLQPPRLARRGGLLLLGRDQPVAG